MFLMAAKATYTLRRWSPVPRGLLLPIRFLLFRNELWKRLRFGSRLIEDTTDMQLQERDPFS